MSYKGWIDPPESCAFGCAHEGPGSCEEEPVHDTNCPAYYRRGAGCRCDDLCPAGEEDRAEHGWKFYPLAPSVAAEKDAKFLAVCEACTAVKYVKDLPADANMAGEANA